MDTLSEDPASLAGGKTAAAMAPKRRSSIATAAAFGLVGAVIVWYATSLYGPGVSSDSVRYLSTAQSLLDGHGFTLYDGNPLLYAPPLFPTLLAALGLLGLDLPTASRILNALIFGLILFTADRWFAARFRLRPSADIAVIAVVLSASLLTVSSYVWTEPLFALLVLVFLIRLERPETELAWGRTVTLGVIVGLACLTRYIGLILIPYGILASVVSSDQRRAKLTHAAAFILIPLAMLAPWLMRNYAISGTLTGARPAPTSPLVEVLQQTASGLAEWYYRIGSLNPVLASITVAVIVLAVVAYFRSKYSQPVDVRLRIVSMLGPGFSVYYIVSLIVLASFFHFDRLGNRLLSPVFVPLLMIVFTVLDQATETRAGRSVRWRKVAVLTISIAWLGTCLIDTVKLVSDSVENGAGGYATTIWQQSEMIAYLKSHPLYGTLYTNAPDVVWLMTGRKAQLGPQREKAGASEAGMGLEEFKETVRQEGPVFFIWFVNMGRPYMYSPRELSEQIYLKPLDRVDDGTLYLAYPAQSH